MKVSSKHGLACLGGMLLLTVIYGAKAENVLFGKVK